MDALSADGASGLTIIAFIGSVFSPYYAWARDRGDGDPYQYCSINVALYGVGGKRWAMTERTSAAVEQNAERFSVGPSAVSWENGVLTVDIDEVTVPIPSRIRGRFRLTPRAMTDTHISLDAAGQHTWWPMFPMADVEVDLDKPGRKWRGTGYFDTNWGSEPLETAFKDWTWMRADTPDGAVILYDVNRRAQDAARSLSVALAIDEHGRVEHFEAPPPVQLPTTGWRVPRWTRGEAGQSTRVVETLEDAPFYSRSVVETTLRGHAVTGVHEGLSLDRFASRWVQVLLPFKMPRVRR